MPIKQEFYSQSSLAVAQKLLGCFLMRAINGRIVKFIIVETEAYEGFRDKASHASRGKTPRNEVMFGPPGHIYVYFTYGMHYMLNIVTGKNGYPSAVLVRAVKPIDKSNDLRLTTNDLRLAYAGPARLTKSLRIDKTFNGKKIYCKKTGLWIEKSISLPNRQIIKAPRVGVDYAEEYALKKWRFYIKENIFISKK